MRPLGIFVWFGYDLPPAESLRRIRAAGFDGVMLWWGAFDGDDAVVPPAFSGGNADCEWRTPMPLFDGCNTLWLSGPKGDGYASGLIRCAEECAACGVDTLVVHITDGPNPPPWHPWG